MLELRSIRKSYLEEPLLRGVSLTVGRRETLCLLGPSGSGKSTILNLISGLEQPEGGQVLWNGRDLAATPPHLRDFGFVFQDYALFPHMDVYDNIAFGPKMKKWPVPDVRRRVNEMLELVDLEGYERRKIAGLSGGEQQRVALARALAPRPRLLMLDEPLGALDRGLRQQLADELRELLARAQTPAIYVTHDQEEGFRVADRVALLHAGQIVRHGKPADIWANPLSAWVAEFLGLGAVFEGTVLSAGRIGSPLGTFSKPCRHAHGVGSRVHLLARANPDPKGPVVRGVVADSVFQPGGNIVTLKNGAYFVSAGPMRKGSHVQVRLRIECLEGK